MRLESIPVPLRYVGVVIMFAACGCLSAAIPAHGQKTMLLLVPIPFALLCARLFPRMRPLVVAVPLIIIAFPIAVVAAQVAVAISLAVEMSPTPDPFFVGGFVGGLSVVYFFAACDERLLSSKYVLGGAVVGCLSVLLFESALWFWSRIRIAHVDIAHRDKEMFLLLVAIWQASLGTYLYAICAQADRRAAQSEGS